jgi:uncharacterized protein
MAENAKFTILSFVGGGIRGLVAVTILNELYTKFPHILDNTDLIAGCSTGSIITSELLAGKTPSQLINFFSERDGRGEISFYDNMNTNPKEPAYKISDAYDSQFALHGDAKVQDVDWKKVLFVSFNVGGLEVKNSVQTPIPWKPLMYTNMDPDLGDVTIAKAATSSGAMPGQLGSYEGNVDGAFFNHDPTVAAIALAVKAGYNLEDITAITIGTGYMPDWIATDTHDWGADQWMNGVANPFDNTPPFLMNQAKSSPVLDMCLNGTSTELMPTIAKMLLGERYANINPTLPLQDKGKHADTAHAEVLLEKYWVDHVLGPVRT